MADLISRRAAIALADELKDDLPDDERIADGVIAHNEGILEYQTALSLLPSAQPEIEKRTAESAQNVLNGELISRKAAIEALTTYIHNMDKVMGTGRLSIEDCKDAAESVLNELPSAQPEPLQVARDIATIIENEQDMRVIAQPEQQWIPCEEQLPEENAYYLVTVEYESGERRIEIDYRVALDEDDVINSDWVGVEKVLAWMPLPSVYQGE